MSSSASPFADAQLEALDRAVVFVGSLHGTVAGGGDHAWAARVARLVGDLIAHLLRAADDPQIWRSDAAAIVDHAAMTSAVAYLGFVELHRGNEELHPDRVADFYSYGLQEDLRVIGEPTPSATRLAIALAEHVAHAGLFAAGCFDQPGELTERERLNALGSVCYHLSVLAFIAGVWAIERDR